MSVKLTLTVHPKSVARGKAYAVRHRTSLSHMVESLFLSLPDAKAAPGSEPNGALTSRLVGMGRPATPMDLSDDRALLAKALEDKFL